MPQSDWSSLAAAAVSKPPSPGVDSAPSASPSIEENKSSDPTAAQDDDDDEDDDENTAADTEDDEDTDTARLLPKMSKEQLVREYLSGIVWCLAMYRSGSCLAYDFTYHHIHAPSWVDILQIGPTLTLSDPLSRAPALLPYVCLMALLPREAAAVVPKALQHLMRKDDDNKQQVGAGAEANRRANCAVMLSLFSARQVGGWYDAGAAAFYQYVDG